MTTWILIRHAQTVANEKGVLSGFSETPLSEIGQKQTEALKDHLKEENINYIYTSPSCRAYETIAPLARVKGREVKCVEDLREIHFGEFEGKSFTWIQAHYPEEVTKMLEEKDDYCYPNGESLVMAHARMRDWLIKTSQLHSDEVIVVCAHAGTIRSMLSEFVAGNHTLHWHFKIDNASISVVTVTDEFAVIEKLNDTSYLKETGCCSR